MLNRSLGRRDLPGTSPFTFNRLLVGAAVGVLLGCRFHGPILSQLDRTQLLVRPDGALSYHAGRQTRQRCTFLVTPGDALRIGGLARGKIPWYPPALESAYVYADTTSYFVVESFPQGVAVCSYYARLLGIRVRGMDGRVYDPSSRVWRRVGFVPMTLAEVADSFHCGMTESDVQGVAGRPFSIEPRGIREGVTVHYWHYLCLEGQFALVIYSGAVERVETEELGNTL